MPRRKSTRDILSDVAAPSSDERRREWERILKLSPGELGSEKQRRRQQARDAQILQALRESYRAGGVTTCDNLHQTQQRREEKE
jgi:hypothetical protein